MDYSIYKRQAMNDKYVSEKFQKYNLHELSENDLNFLIKSYVTKRNDYENIANLIRGDEGIIYKMLDSERVFKKVMNNTEHILEISPYFFFSLLLRRAFRTKGEDKIFIEENIEELNSANPNVFWDERKLIKLLKDKKISNYIANMMAKSAAGPNLFKMTEIGYVSYQQIVTMIADSLQADKTRRFYVYCHIGDYTLYLAGMVPVYVECNYGYRQKPIDKQYFVDFGKTYYSLASEHAKARRHALTDTLTQLSDGFEVIAKVLHFMNKEYIYPKRAELEELHFNHLVLHGNGN